MAGYEVTLFGDGVSTTRVANVSNHYGPRDTGKTVGVIKSEGPVDFLVATFDYVDATDGDLGLETALQLPAGAVVERVWLEVGEAFTLGGTTPTILIGTDGSEVTNGFVVSEAQAEAAGTYDLTSTLTGTWAAPLAAATTVGIALGGTSPTATVAGKAKVIVEFAEVGAV